MVSKRVLVVVLLSSLCLKPLQQHSQKFIQWVLQQDYQKLFQDFLQWALQKDYQQLLQAIFPVSVLVALYKGFKLTNRLLEQILQAE